MSWLIRKSSASPLTSTRTGSVASVELSSVIVLGALIVASGWMPKARLAGATLSAGGVVLRLIVFPPAPPGASPFAAARSGRPSALKSSAATETRAVARPRWPVGPLNDGSSAPGSVVLTRTWRGALS